MFYFFMQFAMIKQTCTAYLAYVDGEERMPAGKCMK